MALVLYNSLSRAKEPFEPLAPGEIKMYVCGPTVYDDPHIGHARSAYIFEVIRRYLVSRGYRVRFVRNVTDVDDKIIERAGKEFPADDINAACTKVARKYLDSYHQALDSLGIGLNPPDIAEPKASEYIGKMIDFIRGLIGRGAAYPSGGDVYFDITKAAGYGRLSNQSLDKMVSGARVAPTEKKRNPLDFALWKSVKENEPFWESPWGRGRPGWHIECSAMSSDILGDEFDIHGGGIDLIFPHHENEVAQSEGAGKKFARYWIHHGLLTIRGSKMAKSLGNFVTIREFLAKHAHADTLKLFFLSAHYSHPIDYTDGKIEEAKQALERIAILKGKIADTAASRPPAAGSAPEDIIRLKERFVEAMDDDLNMPQALAAVFELVNTANRHIDDRDFIRHAAAALQEFLGIFCLTLEGARDGRGISDEEIESAILRRNQARKDKDFALSDKIRNELEAQGIILEDAKDGTTWRRKL